MRFGTRLNDEWLAALLLLSRHCICTDASRGLSASAEFLVVLNLTFLPTVTCICVILSRICLHKITRQCTYTCQVKKPRC